LKIKVFLGERKQSHTFIIKSSIQLAILSFVHREREGEREREKERGGERGV